METFKLVAEFSPTGDQPLAIDQLVKGIKQNKQKQVLLGATGTGKTFTISNVIAKVNKPTLILAHNKTLAGQLYSEFKAFFPENRVEYFVSNFDFYQPEAYMPRTDTYIEKSTKTNKEIEMLRSSAVNSLLERNDTIVVASVAAIYGASNPENYRQMIFGLRVGEILDRSQLLGYLVQRQYSRNNMDLTAGSFRVRGDVIEIMPGHTESYVVRIELFGDEIERITEIEPLTGKVNGSFKTYTIYPADDYATNRSVIERAVKTIGIELAQRLHYYKENGKLLEFQRLDQRTRQDMEMLSETGICSGIENYSRHIDGREPGVRPYTLLDYFPDDFLLVVDESHVMLPQIRGMYNGDRARKETLVEFGFRLPSALDNRPLKFDEFDEICPQSIYISATPGDYELSETNNEYVEQIIRPTGLLDPIVEVRPSRGQIDDIVEEIRIRTKKNQRVLITTLTIKMAEDLSDYLKDLGIKTAYLHSETKTLERTVILRDLRLGKYDVLVGINLLREGLDLPEVSLVVILDADKEGFLRSNRSLIQIIGRAARNAEGKVIMYADKITGSMEFAINETNRRRKIQEEYNQKHGITPKTIIKKVSDLIGSEDIDTTTIKDKKGTMGKIAKQELIVKLQKEMKEAAKDLDFERATELRDIIFELQAEIDQSGK